MNEKANRSKLLAAVAVLVMVVCVFAAIMPADDTEAADTSGVNVPAENQAYVLDDNGGFTGYATLKEAVDSATSGATIYLNKNAATDGIINGDGIVIDTSVKSLTIDFNGLTYNVNGMPVGSSGTETQAFQLLTGGSVTMQDGRITGDGQNVRMLIQNYCNLTLNNMVVDATVGNNQVSYAVSNNCGNVVFSGATTITAKAGAVAFDVCGYSTYGGVSVTIADNFTGSINGKVEMTKSSGNSGNVDLNINADLTISELDAQTGQLTIGNDANVKINTTTIADDVIVDNNGNLDANYMTSTELHGVVSKDTDFTGTDIYDIVVNPGVKLTFSQDVTSHGDMRLYGTIAPATGVNTTTLTVEGGATLTAYSGATVAKGVIVTGDGKIDLSAAMSTVTINDDIESDFTATQSQKVVIADTLTIKSGYSMEILGELVINEGCTVIIEDGAKLVLGSDVVMAKGMTVNGTIDVEVGGTIEVAGSESVTIVGTITSSGTVEINSNVTVENGGKIVIDDYEDSEGVQQSTITVTSGLTVEKGGQISVAGDMTIEDIGNKGTVILNGANITDTSNISLTADGAVVDIRSMTQNSGADLVINDEGMYLYTDRDAKEDITIATDNASSVTFDGTQDKVGIKNMTITASVTSEKVDKDTTKYHSSLVLSGSVSIFDDTDEGSATGYAIAASANDSPSTGYSLESSIEIPESLTIGKNITFTLVEGNMNVDGSMTATADGSVIVSNGQIYVDGMITSVTAITATGINAFHYTDDDYNYYTTLKTAIDNGATDIVYFGNVKVLDTLTIPAETTLSKNSNAEKITIGDGDNRGVIVTVADGAIVRGCTIYVMGTLVFDVNKTSNRNNTIFSDVIIDEEPKRTYTNIYTALDDAADDSTITINQNVFLDKDAEIRQTVTLEIPAAYGVYLDNGVTLTINGTVRNSGAIGNAIDDGSGQPDTTGMAGFNPYLADGVTPNDDRAAIIVNGSIMSMTELEYGTYYIAGAYYQLVNDQGSWYYITPVEQAAAVSNDVEAGEIEIFGENKVSDVTFTGDSDQPVTVTVTGTLDAGTVTLSLAGIAVDGAFTGSIVSAVGTVDATNATGFSVVDTVVGSESTQTLYLTGAPVAADKEADSSVTVASGTVTAGKITVDGDDASDFAISAGATLSVAGTYEDQRSELNVSKMTVDGTLVAADGGNVDADEITVRGTFTVEAEDKDAGLKAGTATVTILYVGIAYDSDRKTYGDASAATVSADKISGLTDVFVSAESTVTGDLTAKMQTTGFYVEGALWMTVYTTQTNKAIVTTEEATSKEVYNFVPGDLVNCDFSYWATEEGNKIVYADRIYIGKIDAVYANLNYNIYNIMVYADPGVDAVYIDGTLMTGQVAGQIGWSASIAAGTHEITYKLANGYTGTATMTVNGVVASGLTFETSGTSVDDRSVTIYLQGIEKAGYVPDSPDTGNGLGLTDYLLIVLVVLIAIMAVIIALRMMRS